VERIMAVRPRTGPGLYRSLNKIPSDEQDRFRVSRQALVREWESHLWSPVSDSV